MKIDLDIIEKVLDNRATPEEAKAVAKWFSEDRGNQFLARYLEKEMEESGEDEVSAWLEHEVPEERMRARLLNRIQSQKKKVIWRRVRVAAVLIPFLFLSLSAIFFMERSGLFTGPQYAEVYVPCGERMQVVLQDGTVVLLNSDTRLKYPQKFSLFHREVELSGEGYFSVAKMRNCPFVVKLDGLDIKVTGTRFNAKSYPDDQNIWVTLEEGSVRLKDNRRFEYSMVPNDKVVYNRVSGEYSVEHLQNLRTEFAWQDNHLNFYMTPLGEILKALRRQYDVQFLVKDSVMLNNRFTLSTAKVNIIDILRDLEFVSHISFVDKGDGTFEVISVK